MRAEIVTSKKSAGTRRTTRRVRNSWIVFERTRLAETRKPLRAKTAGRMTAMNGRHQPFQTIRV